MSMEIDEAVVIGARPGSRPQAESSATTGVRTDSL